MPCGYPGCRDPACLVLYCHLYDRVREQLYCMILGRGGGMFLTDDEKDMMAWELACMALAFAHGDPELIAEAMSVIESILNEHEHHDPGGA